MSKFTEYLETNKNDLSILESLTKAKIEIDNNFERLEQLIMHSDDRKLADKCQQSVVNLLKAFKSIDSSIMRLRNF